MNIVENLINPKAQTKKQTTFIDIHVQAFSFKNTQLNRRIKN